MFSSSNRLWWPRLASLILSALASGSAVMWALRGGPELGAPPAVESEGPRSELDGAAVERVLGAEAKSSKASKDAPPASDRFVLVGVLASGGNHGAALIGVDGKPPKPFHVGAAIDGPWILQATEGRSASLYCKECAGDSNMRLEMPVRSPASGLR